MTTHVDIAVIGGGPAGAATAIRAARAGARVLVVEKGAHGRDKICGDGLTPRAVAALHALDIPLDGAHHIAGLRMIAGKRVRELPWASDGGRFPPHGAVWPRRRLDAALIDAASDAGAEIRFGATALPCIDHRGAVTGVRVGAETVTADLTVLAAGAQGEAARLVGADRHPDEPYGLAIRTYVESPRHADAHIEACLTIRDQHGTSIPGYGWMFPCGDGTVNIGVGALSTMRGFKGLNLNHLLDRYRALVQESWGIGADLERSRAWRLPMSVVRRHGPGWVAVGDAAGLINPMNGEGIDYGLETGRLAASLIASGSGALGQAWPTTLREHYGEAFSIARRLAGLLTVPGLLPAAGPVGMRSRALMTVALRVMGNLVTPEDTDAVARLWRAAGRVSTRLDARPPWT